MFGGAAERKVKSDRGRHRFPRKGTLVMGAGGFGAAPVGVLNAPVLRFGAGDGGLCCSSARP